MITAAIVVGIWLALCALFVLALYIGRPKPAGHVTWSQQIRMGLWLLRNKGGRS